jgi:hypothetical protein
VSPSAVAGHSVQIPATTQVSGFIVPVYDRYEVCKRLVRMVVASRGRIRRADEDYQQSRTVFPADMRISSRTRDSFITDSYGMIEKHRASEPFNHRDVLTKIVCIRVRGSRTKARLRWDSSLCATMRSSVRKSDA